MEKHIKLIIILAVGLVFWLVLRLISGKRKKLHVRFICNLLKTLDIVVCVLAILQVYTDLNKIAAAVLTGGGLVLAVLSFAAQKVLNNILSGIAISMSRPFELGDKIKVLNSGSVIAEGTVSDITLRHTIIMTYDGQSCIIPNGTINESMINNVSAKDRIGNFLEVTVGYNDDLDLAIKIMEEIIRNTENVIDCTVPLIARFDADGPVLKSTIWTATFGENYIACGAIRKKIVESFRENNITIPYQTITISGESDNEDDKKTVSVNKSQKKNKK